MSGSPEASSSLDIAALDALTRIHHAYFLGLQLMVSTRKAPEILYAWIFRLFRRQHEEKFLSSFEKLGLEGLPHAVACAQYHVLSNSVGGVPVEYMYETDRKAWVRFRYPRWMFAGPTICGVTEEASRGFLRGWYAHNGVSLQNPRLGFVCVSEDMTGEYGLCGYFKEYDHVLTDEERLRFAKDQRPPDYDPAAQPAPPLDQWNDERLAKASRNYAVDYLRNGISELAALIGDEAGELGMLAARLIGLNYYSETASVLGVQDAGVASAGAYLQRLFAAMGDEVELAPVAGNADSCVLRHANVRLVRGMEEPQRALLLQCWKALWQGAMQARRTRLALDMQEVGGGLRWQLSIA